MQLLPKERHLTALCIGLFVILVLVFMGNHTNRVEGNPHEVWGLTDEFNTLDEVVAFVNNKHLHKFHVARDDAGFLRVIYEY